MSGKLENSERVIKVSTTSRWDDRSAHRVLDSGRGQVLERSWLIVDAANELLELEGLDRLTIRAVLKKTGLSRRAFYERFAGKDDLMLAVFEQTIRRARRQFDEMLEGLNDPLECLRIIFVSIVLGKPSSDMDGNPVIDRRGAAMSREHMRLAESRPEDLEEALRPLLSLVTLQLECGMDQGKIRKADSSRLATLLYNLVSTTIHTELVAHEAEEPDMEHRQTLADELWAFCYRAIVV